MAFEHLGADYRWARVDDLAAPQTMLALIAAKRALHNSPVLRHDRDPFAAIESHTTAAVAHGALLPDDHGWLRRNVRHIEEAVRSTRRDRSPCHGDGASSNVMLGPEGDVQLVDFDAAGNGDPLYDLATVLIEVHQFDDDVHATLRLYCEAEDDYESLYARCRLYGIVDDLLWGTSGLLAAALSRRPGVEFFKYAQWRLLRCRHNLRDRRFEEWLRKV
jgi:thiamine kinase-like enzyme